MPITTISSIAELRSTLDAARAAGRQVGAVPTMGYLHDGHASLMRAARAENDVVVATIFVNPLQFAEGEDLADYPRSIEADTELAEAAGVDILFTPSVDEMYPFGPVLTTVTVSDISSGWEGVTRPTHFAGVATVVAKLFNITGPVHGYFGEKDFQQLAMLRRMAADLNHPVEVVGMPTIREEDGLAMSSRNLRLLPEHRVEAPVVSAALQVGIDAIDAGERDPAAVEAAIRTHLATATHAEEPDYVAVVDAASLLVPERLDGDVRVLTAVRLGDVRLIDNKGTTIDDGASA